MIMLIISNKISQISPPSSVSAGYNTGYVIPLTRNKSSHLPNTGAGLFIREHHPHHVMLFVYGPTREMRCSINCNFFCDIMIQRGRDVAVWV